MPGSIGSKRQGPVQKGKRMAGHMGAGQVTVLNLEIVGVDVEKQVVYIKGAIPGARGGLLSIDGKGKTTAQNIVKKAEKVEPATETQESTVTA